jgi:transcriptional regulator with XRE-family HTH domain
MMQFKDRLKLAMELGGIGSDVAGMRALAEYLGVTGSAISQALKGQTKFNANNSARAARMLGVDLYWFATGEGEPRDQRREREKNRTEKWVRIKPAAFGPMTYEDLVKWQQTMNQSVARNN